MAEDDINKRTAVANFEKGVRSRQRLVEELKYLVKVLEIDCPDKMYDLQTLVEEAKSKRISLKPH